MSFLSLLRLRLLFFSFRLLLCLSLRSEEEEETDRERRLLCRSRDLVLDLERCSLLRLGDLDLERVMEGEREWRR